MFIYTLVNKLINTKKLYRSTVYVIKTKQLISVTFQSVVGVDITIHCSRFKQDSTFSTPYNMFVLNSYVFPHTEFSVPCDNVQIILLSKYVGPSSVSLKEWGSLVKTAPRLWERNVPAELSGWGDQAELGNWSWP